MAVVVPSDDNELLSKRVFVPTFSSATNNVLLPPLSSPLEPNNTCGDTSKSCGVKSTRAFGFFDGVGVNSTRIFDTPAAFEMSNTTFGSVMILFIINQQRVRLCT